MCSLERVTEEIYTCADMNDSRNNANMHRRQLNVRGAEPVHFKRTQEMHPPPPPPPPPPPIMQHGRPLILHKGMSVFISGFIFELVFVFAFHNNKTPRKTLMCLY